MRGLFLQEMYKFHKPEYIILGLDFWWFNDAFRQPSIFPRHLNDGTKVGFSKADKTLRWLWSGKVDLSTLYNIINNDKILNQYSDYDNLGFNAIRTSDGFMADGSYLYSKALIGIEPSWDVKFSNTFSRIHDGNRRFEYGDELSSSRIKTFFKIVNFINGHGTKIVLIIPPVSNAVFSEMNKYHYSYVNQLRQFISRQKIENYDFSKNAFLN